MSGGRQSLRPALHGTALPLRSDSCLGGTNDASVGISRFPSPSCFFPSSQAPKSSGVFSGSESRAPFNPAVSAVLCDSSLICALPYTAPRLAGVVCVPLQDCPVCASCVRCPVSGANQWYSGGWERAAILEFDRTRKSMGVLAKSRQTGKFKLFVKVRAGHPMEPFPLLCLSRPPLSVSVFPPHSSVCHDPYFSVYSFACHGSR